MTDFVCVSQANFCGVKAQHAQFQSRVSTKLTRELSVFLKEIIIREMTQSFQRRVHQIAHLDRECSRGSKDSFFESTDGVGTWVRFKEFLCWKVRRFCEHYKGLSDYQEAAIIALGSLCCHAVHLTTVRAAVAVFGDY